MMVKLEASIQPSLSTSIESLYGEILNVRWLAAMCLFYVADIESRIRGVQRVIRDKRDRAIL